MAKRSYAQNCALARTSDVLGERWTLLLLRDLLIAPRRFNELLDSLDGIGTNLLAQRLKDLQAARILKRSEGSGNSKTYALTARGRALEPAVLALIRWGLVHGPVNRPGDYHRDDWDLLALKSAFQPERAAQLSVTVAFESPSMQGWAKVADGRMTIGLGKSPEPDIRISGTVADLFLGSEERTRLLAAGEAADLQKFIAAFALRP